MLNANEKILKNDVFFDKINLLDAESNATLKFWLSIKFLDKESHVQGKMKN